MEAAVWHRELSSGLCDDPEGWNGGQGQVQEGGVQVYFLTASCCAAETNTIVKQLYSNKKLNLPKRKIGKHFLFKNSFPGRFLWMHLTCQASDTRVVFHSHLRPDVAGPDLIFSHSVHWTPGVSSSGAPTVCKQNYSQWDEPSARRTSWSPPPFE